jgi:hypothetical protein
VPLPLLESAPPSDRLDPDDAKRVVVLHTSNVLGTDEPIGDLDFFVNPNNFFNSPETYLFLVLSAVIMATPMNCIHS